MIKLEQITYVDGQEPSTGQISLDWIQNGTLLQGATKIDPRAGNLNENSARIQQNVQTLDRNDHVLKTELESTQTKVANIEENIGLSGNIELLQQVGANTTDIAKNKEDILANTQQNAVISDKVHAVETHLGPEIEQSVQRNVSEDLFWIKNEMGQYSEKDINGTDVPGNVASGLKYKFEQVADLASQNQQNIANLALKVEGENVGELRENVDQIRSELGEAPVAALSIYQRLDTNDDSVMGLQTKQDQIVTAIGGLGGTTINQKVTTVEGKVASLEETVNGASGLTQQLNTLTHTVNDPVTGVVAVSIENTADINTLNTIVGLDESSGLNRKVKYTLDQIGTTEGSSAATPGSMEDRLRTTVSIQNEQASTIQDVQVVVNDLKDTIAGMGGGMYGFNTYAEFLAVKDTIPVNSTVIMSEVNNTGTGSWGQGTNVWDGVTLKKSPYDPFQQSKDFVNANAMFRPKTYAAAVDFNTLTSYGTHTFLNGTVWNNSTNRPNINDQYGHLLVFPTTSNVITQIAIMGNNTKTFAMRLRNDLLVWQSWLYFYSFDELVTKIKADFNSYLKPLKTSATANLLDPAQVIPNYEVRPDGTILPSATGSISGLTYCYNREYLYVSGLQTNTGPRYYRFLDQNGNFISGGYLNNGVVESSIPVPPNGYSFQLSLKQGNSNPLDITTAQIEFGKAKTAYVAYAPGAITHINQVAVASTPIQLNSTSSSKNLFDKSAVLNGYEVYNDGRVLVQATSITSPVMDITGLSNVTISGLVANPELVRYCAFKDIAGVVVSVVQIATTSTQATFSIPANAVTMQFSVKQRSAATPDLSVIQVESGAVATTYTPFVRGISSINGFQIVAKGSSGSSTGFTSRAFGAKALFFGDSRVQTSDVDNGDVSGTTFSSNYPKFMKDTLKLSGFKNYAKSGASFAETTAAQLPWQKISHQVQTAIDNGETPHFIVLDAGTNDMNWNRSNEALETPVNTLGTYETAMSKSIDQLDRTKTAEAMRWALYKIRENFPDAVCFYATQTQRADTETTYQDISNNIMVKLAKRYGFHIIDGLYGFGIVKDFEVWNASGRYLRDGLHMNTAGQQLMNNFYSSQIIQRMTY